MSHGILIRSGELSVIEYPDGYNTIVTLPDDSSLIDETDWILLVTEFGSEETVMEILVTSVTDPKTEEVVIIPIKDCRQPDEYHYIIPVIEDGSN